MLKKTALAIAATIALGAAALAPTSASAGPWHHHHHGWWGFYGGPAFYAPAYYGNYGGPGCYVGRRWVWTHAGWVLARRPICY